MPRQTDMHPGKSLIKQAREEGRAHADNSEGPLAMVAIPQAYFRMVARMAMRSADPKTTLEDLLEIHNTSARIELRELMGVRP